jgi:outer membrane protein OmpA-like peptidoglycan-associated protein
MSDVEKLKTLLFQAESAAIADLRRRMDDVYERAGSDARFEASVTRNLDGALRTAEVERHAPVATALAPLVVKTIKTEIGNSTDELVQALYPQTGRMVRAYVASAIRELTESINRRLERNPLFAGLAALTGGASAAEIALVESQRLVLEDMLLIRRGTGELLARWPTGETGSNLDHVLGGVLTAINDVTAEAFKADGAALRQIDLGERRIYLRMSPSFLLAARCKGTASAAAERILDDEFTAMSSRFLDAPQTAGQPTRTELLGLLAQRIERRLAALRPTDVLMRRGVRPFTVLLLLIGLPLLAWGGWSAYVELRKGYTLHLANLALDRHPEIVGYPVRLKITDHGATLVVSGLAPTPAVEAAVLRDIAAAVPGVTVRDEMAAVPAGADPTPMIERLRQDQTALAAEVKAAEERQLRARAQALLMRAAATLSDVADPAAADVAARFAGSARTLASEIDGARSAEALAAVAGRADGLRDEVQTAARTMLDLGAAEPARADGTPGDILVAADGVLLAAQALTERAAMKRRLAEETAALRGETRRLEGETRRLEGETRRLEGETRRLEDETRRLEAGDAAIRAESEALRSNSARLETETRTLRDQIAALAARGPSPREQIIMFSRSNAIFFSDGTTYRDGILAESVLDQLADLMRDNDTLMRVIGYTDEAGSSPTNLALGQARAQAVADSLISRGIPANRLVVLRRTSPERNVSPVTGVGSANRRVEFEVGFVGEGGG